MAVNAKMLTRILYRTATALQYYDFALLSNSCQIFIILNLYPATTL